MAPTLRLLQHLIEQETANEMFGDRITDAPRGRDSDRDHSLLIFVGNKATSRLQKKNADGIYD